MGLPAPGHALRRPIMLARKPPGQAEACLFGSDMDAIEMITFPARTVSSYHFRGRGCQRSEGNSRNGIQTTAKEIIKRSPAPRH